MPPFSINNFIPISHFIRSNYLTSMSASTADGLQNERLPKMHLPYECLSSQRLLNEGRADERSVIRRMKNSPPTPKLAKPLC
jgi:hypothetical protein